MRRSFLVYFAAGAAVSVLACTAVLGDFTVSGSATGDGGGGGDGSMMGDGGGGGDGGDGSADAPPPLKPLSCSITPPKVSFSYADIDAGMISVGDSPRMLVYQLPSRDYRILVPTNSSVLYADFSGNESQPVHFKVLSIGAGGPGNAWIMAMSRFAAGATSTPGTAIMTASSNAAGDMTVGLIRFDDGAAAPGARVTLIDGSGGVLPTNLGGQQLVGAVEVLDVAGEYLLMIEYATSANLFTLAGAHVRGAPAHPRVIDTNLAPNQPTPYSIAHDATNAWLLLFPPSNNGPPSGPMPLYKVSFADMSRVSSRQLAPPSGFYAPFAFQTSTTPGMADIAFLQADLNQQTKLPVFHVGQVKLTDLDTFDPSTVSGPELPLADLTFNKGVAAWQTFASPSGDQFVTSSRPLNDGTPGVTVLWIDAQGRMRFSVAALDGGSGWPTGLVGSIAVSHVSPPAASFAQLRVAWLEGQGGNPATPPIFSMGGTCLP